MSYPKQNLTVERVLKSFEDGFDQGERAEIFKKLENDDTLDDALLGMKLLLQANGWDYRAVKAALDKAENRIDDIVLKNESKQTKTQNGFNLKYAKYAALLLPFLAWIGYTTLNTGKNIDDFYVPETGLPNLMSVSSKNDWKPLMDLYQTGELEEAFTYSLELKEKRVSSDTALYFNAVIAYDLEKYEIANRAFQAVVADGNSTFFYDAQYRLGLSLYQLGKKAAAEAQFKKIKETRLSPYTSEASLILQELF